MPIVTADGRQMEQVFMNLLLNAIQAIPGKGTVRVRTRTLDGGIAVSVSDDGVAQVDDAGWVTGVADGTAEVRAVVDGVTGSRLVTVTASATS